MRTFENIVNFLISVMLIFGSTLFVGVGLRTIELFGGKVLLMLGIIFTISLALLATIGLKKTYEREGE